MVKVLNRTNGQFPDTQVFWTFGGQTHSIAEQFWHDHAINHLAYGFPYDDVAGQSSFVSHGDPQWLLVAVGY
jgi:hypothetical protein